MRTPIESLEHRAWLALLARVDRPEQAEVASALRAEFERLGAPFYVVGDDGALPPMEMIPILTYAIEPRYTGVVCKQYKITAAQLPLAVFAGPRAVSGRRKSVKAADAPDMMIGFVAALLDDGMSLPERVLELVAARVPS